MNGDPSATVHVVDGDPAVRDSLTTLLDLNGYSVAAYATAAAYLEADNQTLPAGQERWIVCEAELPDGSGIDLFGKVQAANRDAAFILLVSRRDPAVMAMARAAGIDRIYSKPLVHRRLIEAIGNRSH
ncbi:MAG: response regulator [Pseudomonadota bacterium]